VFNQAYRAFVTAVCFVAIATSASAQASKERWVANREAKQQRAERIRSEFDVKSGAAGVAGAQPKTVTNVLTLTSLRRFADTFGDLVVVGEVQNGSASTLSFSKARFNFYNGAVFVGSDFSYIFGSRNGRLALTGSFIDVLPPGAVGFFKVWTSIPATSVSNLYFSSDAETYALSPVGGDIQPVGPIVLGVDSLGFSNYSGAVRNTARSFATYFTQVALAGYLGGTIADVDFTYVNGSSGAVCGVSASDSEMLPGTTAPYSGFFLEPVSSIGRLATQWDECAVAPLPAMTGATLTADRAAPRFTGDTVTFTAAGSGGVGPYAFKFLVTTNNWATYSIVREWSTTPTFTWTPLAPGSYQVGVWARSAWDTADAAEAAASMPFAIVRSVMTSATISSDKASPQSVGTTVTFMVAGTGGAAPYSFKFLLTSDNWATFSVVRDWSAATTLPWAPTTTGTYQMGIWARSAGSVANAPEQAAALGFAIAAPLTITVQGSGTVTAGDGLINCPSVGCTHLYTSAVAVTLQATPLTGSSSPDGRPVSAAAARW
jgi:hypothetical protein